MNRVYLIDISLSKEKVDSRNFVKSCIERDYGLKIEDSEFWENENGKPAFRTLPLSFNLSHSSSLMALYLSSQPAVGLDLQVVRSRYSITEIARECFEEEELQWMEREDGFFMLWAMKEALVKYHGATIWDFHRYGSVLPLLNQFSLFSAYYRAERYYMALYPKAEALTIPASPLWQAVL